MYPDYDPTVVDAYRLVYWMQVLIMLGPAFMLTGLWNYGLWVDWTAEEAAYSMIALGWTTVLSMTAYAFLGRLLSISAGKLHIRVMKYWVPFTSWLINLGALAIGAYVVDD